MGSVYRKVFTKSVPAGAEIKAIKGERWAVWRDRKGKPRKERVTTGEDGADRIAVESPTFVAKYRDGRGVVRTVSTGCRHEQAARQKLADLERTAERIRAGVITADDEAAARHHTAPVETHFAAFEQHQLAHERAAKYRENTMRALRRLAAEVPVRTLADVRREPFERWLVARTAEGMAAGTRNRHREAWVAFVNWCVKSSRLSTNLLAGLPKANERADRRRERRPLTDDELARLLDVARARPLNARLAKNRGDGKGQPGARLSPQTRAKLDRAGREHALIYKTLVLTGLRLAELRSITVGQVHTAADAGFIELHAADEKNRKGSAVPLRADLAADLATWMADERAGAAADARLFAVPVHLNRSLQADLKAAGISTVDGRGFVVDVHALRHTFGTNLARGGVSPRTAQELMRHSDQRLTNAVYTSLGLQDTRGALDALPALPLAGRELAPVLAPATGFNRDNLTFNDIFGDVLEQHRSRSAFFATPCSATENGPGATCVAPGPSSCHPNIQIAAVGFEDTDVRSQAVISGDVAPTPDSACTSACTSPTVQALLGMLAALSPVERDALARGLQQR